MCSKPPYQLAAQRNICQELHGLGTAVSFVDELLLDGQPAAAAAAAAAFEAGLFAALRHLAGQRCQPLVAQQAPAIGRLTRDAWIWLSGKPHWKGKPLHGKSSGCPNGRAML